jgi:hypothetical protein
LSNGNGDFYKGNLEKLRFHCNKCNDDFICRWVHVVKGGGCSICRGFQVGKSNGLFYIRPDLAKEWSDRNLFSPKEVSFGSDKKAWWKCSKCCNEWVATISSRVSGGNGCPRCKESRGEKQIEKILTNWGLVKDIDFKREYKFPDCMNFLELPFDFYLLNYNICIEYHGRQHYDKMGFWGGDKKLERTQRNDGIKEKYCNEKEIKLIIIPYKKYNKIQLILEKELFPLRKEET